MTPTIERFIAQLRVEIQALGAQGGVLSPSIYDTAQVLRYAPPQDPRPAIDWLLRQQRPDGGWAPEVLPLARHIPTLAAVLALRQSGGDSPEIRRAVERGIAFFRDHAGEWAFEGALPDDIPVAAELTLPRLLGEAAEAGIDLPQKPFQTVRALGDRRRGLIARMKPRKATAPIHGWESWGTAPDLAVLDESGGVGNSPAATAYWVHLHKAAFPDRSEERQGAERFLRESAEASGAGIPGVVPTVWPIHHFEQSWCLYALFITGLLNHPDLQDVVRPQLEDLRQALRPKEGYGMSAHFVCDGDLTSTSIVTLKGAGYQMDGNQLSRYQLADGQFITYEYELQPSVTTTAHGVMALAELGKDVKGLVNWLLEKQGGDGRWMVDKWHISWLYTTSQVVLALIRAGATGALQTAVKALLETQRKDGGWGVAQVSTLSETSYAVQALLGLRTHADFGALVRPALQRAARWMLAQKEDVPPEQREHYWIGKELYRPYRLDRIFELSAMLALELNRDDLSR
ncbi:prenyltransferase/squalene oxidase repeat-containing protein [Archangium lipolyticum]|uniref:prenyltransferase/squalene oxidase repeat-containing protein n=1 Tax=Archangium lipolyticum TaxID=2970465 RepID=UPI00214A2A94|nr:prenyltransferase/squalene oxidase repeat-containing protein [Archangium lipolyticum]